MTEAEVNKVIADYMGEVKAFGKNYHTHSLDTLVPAWRKLGEIPHLFITEDGNFSAYMKSMDDTVRAKAKTIQLAAAITTAKAIKDKE